MEKDNMLPKAKGRRVKLAQKNKLVNSYRYLVLELTNLTKPKVGTEIVESEVNNLISNGVTVSIKIIS